MNKGINMSNYLASLRLTAVMTVGFISPVSASDYSETEPQNLWKKMFPIFSEIKPRTTGKDSNNIDIERFNIDVRYYEDKNSDDHYREQSSNVLETVNLARAKATTNQINSDSHLFESSTTTNKTTKTINTATGYTTLPEAE